MATKLAYGLWPSPITPASLAQGVRLSDLAWDDASGALLWLEGRSDRGVAVCATPGDDAPRDLNAELSVRARVGYGGGDIAAAHGYAYLCAGNRLYRQPLRGGGAIPITPLVGECAAPTPSPDGKWLLYVYSYEGVDGLAIVDSAGALWPQKLVGGDDFYMQPAWHPDGRHIAWVSWRHPQMPWDGTTLGLAELRFEGGGAPTLAATRVTAGDDHTAIFQPTFSPDGRTLAYISDASGWDGLYLYDLASGKHTPLVVEEAELGEPAWAQGRRTYAWAADGQSIYYCRCAQGLKQLWTVNVANGHAAPVAPLAEYTDLDQIAVSRAGQVALLASSWRTPARLISYAPHTGAVRIMARSSTESVPSELLSQPQPLSWTSAEGDAVYGLYYPPARREFESTGKPPLIVMVHGGPTGQSPVRYASAIQFFATRGYAVLDVNYRGSTGYGRAYRNALREQWGLYDVDDAVSGARRLGALGEVDADKMVIMGGSAGGYTVLEALSRYPHAFKAGICNYGVTNLFTLAADTHKFEQRYLDALIGPLPEAAARYRERSPIFHAERIADAVAVFQGEEDRVVPKEQAETIVAALRRSGVPHEFHLYPGEGHGWRKSETILAYYEAVLRFLRQYVLFA